MANAVTAAPQWQEDYRSAARLHVATNGGDLYGGLQIRLEPDWKTYWRSPGSTGIPPRIDWSGSTNVADVELLYPAPERFVAFGFETLGYTEGVTFPLRIVPRDPSQPVALDLGADVLVCGEVCVPARYDLATIIPAARSILPKVGETPIGAAITRVPVSALDHDVALSRVVASEGSLDVELQALGADGGRLDDALLVAEIDDRDPLMGRLALSGGGRLTARLATSDPPMPGTRLRFTIVGDDLPLDLTGTVAAAVAGPLPVAPPADTLDGLAAGLSFWTIVAFAFVGGLILNVMPCVLPVLAIKLAAFGRGAGRDRRAVRLGFAVTAAGILTFVAVLAAVLVGLRALGQDVFWGMQFQQPLFVAALLLILGFFTLNLLGFAEVRIPGRMASTLGRHAQAGDYLDGLLVALIATPCTAPFLGTAISFALAGTTGQLAATFGALGVGFATPYLLVAAIPRAARIMPRPGRWMVILQRVLALPMIVVLIWLAYVLSNQIGPVWFVAVLAALAIFALTAVVRRPAPAASSALALLIIAYFAVAPSGTVGDEKPFSGASTNAGATHWTPFEAGAIASHVADGHVVFVDVTADWCITCAYNKAAAIDRQAVASELARPDVIAMQADWTAPNEAIAAFLKSHDRYGIPMNVVYGPAAPDGILLPEILSVSVVLDALTAARDQPRLSAAAPPTNTSD